MLSLTYEALSAEVERMVISDGSLRAANFTIRAHGETWWDDQYRRRREMSSESRLIFIVQGGMNYEIFGKKYEVGKNCMFLIPERHTYSIGIPEDGYAHVHYCNFNATLESESLFDYLEGEWVVEIKNRDEVVERFKRFHRVDKNNLILDCLEKRSNLLLLLTEFVRAAGINTVDEKTIEGDMLNGIAQYIRRYDGPHEELKIERLAKIANNNQRYFIAKFKKRFGKTPMQYAADVRLDKARDYLDGTSLSIGEIARILAFDDPKYFSKFFKRRTGQTPTEYRKSRGK